MSRKNRKQSASIRYGLYESPLGERSLFNKFRPKITDREIEHIVKEGETLYSIATHYKVTIEEIKKWNNLTSNKIDAFQKLILYVDDKEYSGLLEGQFGDRKVNETDFPNARGFFAEGNHKTFITFAPCTFWSLAARFYGHGRYYKQIWAYNTKHHGYSLIEEGLNILKGAIWGINGIEIILKEDVLKFDIGNIKFPDENPQVDTVTYGTKEMVKVINYGGRDLSYEEIEVLLKKAYYVSHPIGNESNLWDVARIYWGEYAKVYKRNYYNLLLHHVVEDCIDVNGYFRDGEGGILGFQKTLPPNLKILSALPIFPTTEVSDFTKDNSKQSTINNQAAIPNKIPQKALRQYIVETIGTYLPWASFIISNVDYVLTQVEILVKNNPVALKWVQRFLKWTGKKLPLAGIIMQAIADLFDDRTGRNISVATYSDAAVTIGAIAISGPFGVVIGLVWSTLRLTVVDNVTLENWVLDRLDELYNSTIGRIYYVPVPEGRW